jgi:hypothetical protein
MNYCKLLCAFTECHVDSVHLRFDKMMLRFVYYPLLGAPFPIKRLPDEKRTRMSCVLL